MKKWFSSVLCFTCLLVLLPSLHAQAKPTATGRGGDIQAGVGYMFLNNDYTGRENKGASIWVDYDFNRYIGVEGEAHFGGIVSPDDIGENSYLVGPRGRYVHGKFEVIGKIMFGRATISNQIYDTSSSFAVYAFGGGLDYRIKPKFKIRFDFESQRWPDFEPNTLSPTAISIGLIYRIR